MKPNFVLIPELLERKTGSPAHYVGDAPHGQQARLLLGEIPGRQKGQQDHDDHQHDRQARPAGRLKIGPSAGGLMRGSVVAWPHR